MSQLQTVPGDNQAVPVNKASEYVKAWRKNPAGKTCDCSRPAYINSNGVFICKICHDLETAAKNHYVSQQMRVEKMMKPFAELSEIRQRRFNTKSMAERMAEYDRGENRFRSVLLDSGSEITIVGHGEYHLAIERKAA